ncbi:helix-turn-helix transcriptional regulator [Tardiphaga sp. 709]|uniref:helix-turn-helix domain-containing protein n=1 Tax=Tardiphaga sp. 709 TaxID=3076039 RepID=UPI0028EF458B|nr:helix-turn-helix transcriptional regulator [Tardiphaga sp. 709]WNV10121.1 helix-turn-helix transcriptional regulator [Tardiphaga sp. 709]
MTDATDTDREALRVWIREGLARKGIKPTRLAREIDTATTTITKFLNDPFYKFTPSTPVIAKLERYFGAKAPRGVEDGGLLPAGDIEGSELDVSQLSGGLQAAIKGLIGSRRGVEVWELRSRALADAGYHPGDILLIDTHEAVNAGEAVLATVVDAQDGTRRPLFRLYQKPYLVAANTAPEFRDPLPVDDRYVIVRGLILGRISWRHG